MPEIKPVEDNIQIPEVKVDTPPIPENKIPPPPERPKIAETIDKTKHEEEQELLFKLNGNPWFWLLYPAEYALLEIFFDALWVIGEVLDAVFGAILDFIYEVWQLFYTFFNSISERYHGDFVAALLDLVVRVIELEALDWAMNIPAIKDIVDTIIQITKTVKGAFTDLRNNINAAFHETLDTFGANFHNLYDVLPDLIQQWIAPWYNDITKLITGINGALTQAVDKVEKELFQGLYNVDQEVERLKGIVEKMDKEFKDKAVSTVNDAIKKLTEIHYIELGPKEVYQWLRSKWQELKEKTTEYLNRIYQLFEEHTTIDTFDLSALYREMKEELFNDDSEMNKYIDKLISEIEELDNWLEEGNTVKVVIKSDTIEEVREKKQ